MHLGVLSSFLILCSKLQVVAYFGITDTISPQPEDLEKP
jgi:hypothetical protein